MTSMPYYKQIAVINQSTMIVDIDGSNMVMALNILLPKFCTSWSISQVDAVYIPKNSINIPETAYRIYLLDTADIDGVLAYHTLRSDIPYGNVFVNTILSSGGVILYEASQTMSTVAQCLAHEVFELLIDPRCNIWWMNFNTGQLFAGEVCDPVQSNVVLITLSNGVNVGLSDWILPSWQDAQNTKGPFNYLNTLTSPFEIKNGYAMIIKNSNITSIYNNSKPLANSHSQIGTRHSKRASLSLNMS